MDGYEKTPTLGLNKPAKGDFDWDAPLNENWDILDKIGGGQLPLLATIDLDYKLSGDAAIGWALQGSTLSGDTYISLWDAMKAAYDRSTAANETHYNKTYSVRTDSVTGWRFVTADVYNNADTAMGDSLGHVLDASAKTIRLRQSGWSYDLPSTSLEWLGKVHPETLPNVKGEFYVSNVSQDFNGSNAGASRTNGMFAFTQTGGTLGSAWNNASGGIFNLNAGRLNTSGTGVSPYGDNRLVRPQSKVVFRYYKVGNTLVNLEKIDLGNVLKEVQAVSSNSANTSLSNVTPAQAFKEQSVGWGMPDYSAGIASPNITPSNPYTATIDCILYGCAYNGKSYVNGNMVALGDGAAYKFPVTIKLSKGDTITTTATKIDNIYIIPLKGVN